MLACKHTSAYRLNTYHKRSSHRHTVRAAASEQTTGAASVYDTSYRGQIPDVQFNSDGIVSFTQHGLPRVTAPERARPIVVLPGFGNNTADYTNPFGKDDSLANNLKARGFPVHIVQLERKDWFRVARSIFTLRFWSSTLDTAPGYTWYLKRVNEAVQTALEETGAEQVDLVGHSAGGWLGRAFIADPAYFPQQQQQQQQQEGSAGTNGSISTDGNSVGGTQLTQLTTAAMPSLPPLTLTLPQMPGTAAALQDKPDETSSTAPRPNPRVRSIITLGTPQKPPPADKVRDVTGGAVGWVHRKYPGAFFKDQGVSYINVCGLTVKGKREVDSNGKLIYDTKRRRTPSEYAYDSYNQVCADGMGTEGDAVVPLRSAFLADARQLVIPGAWHSMSRIGTFEEESGTEWYGTDSVVDLWLHAYMETAYPSS